MTRKEMLKDRHNHVWIPLPYHTTEKGQVIKPFGLEELYYTVGTVNQSLGRYRYVLGWDGKRFIAPRWLRLLFDHESRSEFDYWVKHDLILKGGEKVVFYPEEEMVCFHSPCTSKEYEFVRMPFLREMSTNLTKYAFHTIRGIEPHISPIARAKGIEYLDWTYVHQDGFDWDDGEQYIAVSVPSIAAWNSLNGDCVLGHDIIHSGIEMVSVTKNDVHVVYIEDERRWVENEWRRH